VEGKWTAIPILGEAMYFIPTEGGAAPYFEVGSGIYMLKFSVKASADCGGHYDSGEDSVSWTKFGFNFGAGVRFAPPESRTSFGVGARYHIVMTEGDTLTLLTAFARLFIQ
jgi:opacity protein-like surface antigen